MRKLFCYNKDLMHHYSVRLQEKVVVIPFRKQKFYAVSFCILFTMINVLVIIDCFTNNIQVLDIATISKPLQLIKNIEPNKKSDSIIKITEYQDVERIKNYISGLQKDPSQTQVYDSIMKLRPGILDSIRQYEKIYLQQ